MSFHKEPHFPGKQCKPTHTDAKQCYGKKDSANILVITGKINASANSDENPGKYAENQIAS